jgi:hypothetical protein
MKSLIVLMSVLTASLAVTDVYLLKQLGAERERTKPIRSRKRSGSEQREAAHERAERDRE